MSYTELGTSLGMSKNTIERYLDLLEKAFVIQKLAGFSRNLRWEITKNSRYYFLDNGVRNALINNFNALDLRNDTGLLWENYLAIERLKRQEYLQEQSNNYFWRTYSQKEIDLVEEREGKLFGYEMKWGGSTGKAAQRVAGSIPRCILAAHKPAKLSGADHLICPHKRTQRRQIRLPGCAPVKSGEVKFARAFGQSSGPFNGRVNLINTLVA